MAAERLPPCIVLGLETQIGLSLVRELGSAGIAVIGIAQTASAIGLRSRYLSEGRVVAPRSEALLALLRELGERWGPCPLLAVSEVNLNWLSRERARLGVVQPVLPAADALAVVLDKQATLARAQAVGLAVPQSLEHRGDGDLHAFAARCPLPAVLKWKDPNAQAPLLAAHGLALHKAEYVYSRAELLAALQRYTPLGQWPLVQEYCAGYGLGQFFYMHKGEALQRFQHRRVAEWPPEGGFSSVCDVLSLHEHQALQAQSIALLRAIGWEGVAMVEYRYDPASGSARLMEINGRFWGSYPLAWQAGAGFAVLAYRLALGLPAPAAAPAEHLRCRMVATELKRLLRIVLQPHKIADRQFRRRPLYEIGRFLLDFVRPRVGYYVWSWRDPRPWLADMANLLARRS